MLIEIEDNRVYVYGSTIEQVNKDTSALTKLLWDKFVYALSPVISGENCLHRMYRSVVQLKS